MKSGTNGGVRAKKRGSHSNTFLFGNSDLMNISPFEQRQDGNGKGEEVGTISANTKAIVPLKEESANWLKGFVNQRSLPGMNQDRLSTGYLVHQIIF
jgi:hypothetical protein